MTMLAILSGPAALFAGLLFATNVAAIRDARRTRP